MKSIRPFVLLAAVLLLAGQDVFSQGCAMCRVAPESNMKEGGNVAQFLNTGILYLMAIPYILIIGAVWYFFRKQIAQKFRELGWKKAAH